MMAATPARMMEDSVDRRNRSRWRTMINLNAAVTAVRGHTANRCQPHDRRTKKSGGMTMSVKQRFDLTGRVALVTGGSRGLGLQMAEALAEMGARLALVARKGDELDEAAAELRAQWAATSSPWPQTCRNRPRIGPVVERAIAALGPIDVLINNAGTTWGAATIDHPLEAWQKVVDLQSDLDVRRMPGSRPPVDAPSAAGQDHQHRINTWTRRRRRPWPPATLAYNTTKGGWSISRGPLAAEWAQYNINVNAIAPGFFRPR
jgi:gluconate 5-dehydrogenase